MNEGSDERERERERKKEIEKERNTKDMSSSSGEILSGGGRQIESCTYEAGLNWVLRDESCPWRERPFALGRERPSESNKVNHTIPYLRSRLQTLVIVGACYEIISQVVLKTVAFLIVWFEESRRLDAAMVLLPFLN